VLGFPDGNYLALHQDIWISGGAQLIPPLWKRGVRADFINHKLFHMVSKTPLRFSKTSLSENLRTFSPMPS